MKVVMLCAIVPAALAGEASPPDDVEFVSAGGLAAALWTKGDQLARPQDKRAFAKALLEQQRVLEALASLGPVLPAAPGTLLQNREEALRMLRANAEPLAAALAEHGLNRQWQVRVDWLLPKALERHAADADVRAAVAAAAPRGRAAIGKALQAAMERVRARVRADYESRIAAVARDVVALPVETEAGLVNLVAAVGPEGEGALERALEAIDAEAGDTLKIKLIGPLPALSFAAVRLDRPEPKRLAEARQRLGVGESATLNDIVEAFRARVFAAHPDRAGDSAEAQAAVEARDLLVRVVAAREALPEAERGPPPPLALVRRDGEAERAA